jgi:hypothetical protein
MKIIFCLTFLVSMSALAKSGIDFSQAINEDVKKEIRKDEDKFKKESFRGPASVEVEHENVIEDVPKIDKNIRQIGPNKW